jgi:outer membrane protein, heavy metal efflux system
MRRSLLLAFWLAIPLHSWAQAPLTLIEAQRLASSDAPTLAAQRAAVDAARQLVAPAGEQADPKLILGIDNVPVDGADRFSVARDFMTMRRVGVMQDVTRGDKRVLRGQRAAAEVRREEVMLTLTEVNLRRDVALAWIDAYFADRQLTLLKALEQETRLQVTAAEAALAGGKSTASEPFAARLNLMQLADREIDAERMAARARAGLARWVGQAAGRPLGEAPAFDQLASQHRDVIGHLDQLPHLAQYGPLQDAANADLKLAQAAKQPDWSWEVIYAQRGSAYSNMVSLGVRIDLPIFQSRRQDPAVAAKVAQAEQVRAQAEAARREHEADIKAFLADWQAAKRRIDRYAKDLLPLARERSTVALAAYRGGKGDLMPVIDARKAEIDTQLSQLQAEQELARAWAQLNFLFPDSTAKANP